MLCLKLLKLVFEMLNVLLFALTEGALRGSILGAATLITVLAGASGVSGVSRHLRCAYWRHSLYPVGYSIAFSVGLPLEAG